MGLGKVGFKCTRVTWLVGWRGHPDWRTSGWHHAPATAASQPGGPGVATPAQLPAPAVARRQALREPLRAVAADTADESVLLKHLEKW